MQAIAAGILGAFIFVVPVHADGLPGFTRVSCSGTPASGPVYQSQSCAGTQGDSATADLSGTSARAAGTALDGTYDEDEVDRRFGASAQTNYYFLVVPPGNYEPGVKVPVRIDAFLTTGATATEGDFLYDTFAQANLLVKTDPVSDFAAGACSGYPCGGSATVDVSVTIDLYELLWNEVSLTALVELDSLFPSSASALADPFIQIDPVFLRDHPGYSLEFSDNITNGPTAPATVPEPSTVWLISGGLLALIGLRRRS